MRRLRYALHYALLPFVFAVIIVLWFGAWIVEIVKATKEPPEIPDDDPRIVRLDAYRVNFPRDISGSDTRRIG
jgi:hypothetical protein